MLCGVEELRSGPAARHRSVSFINVSHPVNPAGRGGLYADPLPRAAGADIAYSPPVELYSGQTVAFWVTVTRAAAAPDAAAAQAAAGAARLAVTLTENDPDAPTKPLPVAVAVGLRPLPFGIAPAGSANQSQVVDLGFEFAAFFGSAGSSPHFAAADAKRLYGQLAGYRANRLVACGAIAAGPKLTWNKDGTRVAGLETADTDALIAAALTEGFGAFAVKMPLYNPPFSRTVWRLCGGAKGLVMCY
jgi:hypothetical protein